MKEEVEKEQNERNSGKGTEWRKKWKSNGMKEEVEKERNEGRSKNNEMKE